MMQIDKINKTLDSLHDAKLIAIEDNLEINSSKLTFILEDEKTVMYVFLNEIISSRCSDWKLGNIVLDATVISEPTQRAIDIIIYIEELSKVQIDNQIYLPILDKIQNKRTFIFEINPSYGAYFVAIIKNIKIEERNLESLGVYH